MVAFDDFQREISALHAPELAELSLTLAQLKAIYLVASGGPIRMTDLAARMGTVPSTTSGLVDRLVQMDLLERFDDPTNRRQVLVRATPVALDQVQAMSELNRDRLRMLLTRVPSIKDIKTIERAIRLMTGAASEMTTETEPE